MAEDASLSFFELCDQDCDGYITLAELKQVFKGKTYDEKFYAEFVNHFDKNHDGKISRAEYSEIVAKLSPKDKEVALWRAIFNLFDLDHDGFITREEVQSVLSDIGNKGTIKYTLHDFENFVKTYDKNQDGKIDYEEFIQFLKGHN